LSPVEVFLANRGQIRWHEGIRTMVVIVTQHVDVTLGAKVHRPGADNRELCPARFLDDRKRDGLEVVASTHPAPLGERPVPLGVALPAPHLDGLLRT